MRGEATGAVGVSGETAGGVIEGEGEGESATDGAGGLPNRKSRPRRPGSSPRVRRGAGDSNRRPGASRVAPSTVFKPGCMPTSLPVCFSVAARRGGSHRDDAISLLHRGRALQDLI